MIITIAGTPGAGKTTIARLLSQRLGIPWYSVGDLRGKMAQERGMTIDQLNALGEREAFTDTEVDEYQRQLGTSGQSFIMEGRLSWHFIPHSFKVFLTADPAIAGRRLHQARLKNNERSDEPLYTSPEDAAHYAAERIACDQRRFEKYYGVDFLNPTCFDLAIDTSNRLTAQETVDEILAALPRAGGTSGEATP